MIAVVNTQDATWAVDKESYPPSKESTWKHPASEDGWMHAHNALRGELKDFVDAIQVYKQRSGDANEWAITAIQKIWKEHMIHMHAHHGSEDDIMTPFMMTRINLPEKLTDDHKEIVDLMNNVTKAIETLKPGDSLDGILDALESYDGALRPHLEEEEAIGLPLLRAYFEPDEVGAVIQKILSKSPGVELGSFIHYMGIQDFRQKFMKANKIPFFVWYIVFQSKYKYYMRNFKEPIDSLKIGEDLPRSGLFSCMG